MKRRYSIPMPSSPGEALYIEGRESGTCDIHDWSDDDIRRRLLVRLRETHGRGGTNVCRQCIARIRALRALDQQKAP